MNILQTSADLEAAFHEWNETLYRYVCARVNDHDVAEDIVQEVFIKAWRSRESYDSQKSSLKNWLFVITINTTRDFFRSKKHMTEELEENTPDLQSVDGEFSQKESVKFVFQKMKLLPERDQELLLLRYTEELSVNEIADALKMKYSAAKVALHRATQRLRELCQDISV